MQQIQRTSCACKNNGNVAVQYAIPKPQPVQIGNAFRDCAFRRHWNAKPFQNGPYIDRGRRKERHLGASRATCIFMPPRAMQRQACAKRDEAKTARLDEVKFIEYDAVERPH